MNEQQQIKEKYSKTLANDYPNKFIASDKYSAYKKSITEKFSTVPASKTFIAKKPVAEYSFSGHKKKQGGSLTDADFKTPK